MTNLEYTEAPYRSVHLPSAARFFSQISKLSYISKVILYSSAVMVILGLALVFATNGNNISRTSSASPSNPFGISQVPLYNSLPGPDASPINPEQMHTTINVSSSSTTQNSGVNLTVNGESIPVPPNGTIHKTIDSSGGHTSLNLNVNSSSLVSGLSSESTNIHIHSNISVSDSSQ